MVVPAAARIAPLQKMCGHAPVTFDCDCMDSAHSRDGTQSANIKMVHFTLWKPKTSINTGSKASDVANPKSRKLTFNEKK